MEANRYLKGIIATVLGIGAMGFSGTDAHAQSYCNSGGCVVVGNPGGGGPGGPGGGGGGWGGGDTDYEQPVPPPDPAVYCPALAYTKPANCPNPIPTPAGHDYGKSTFPSGSGIARAIAWVDHQTGVNDSARQTFKAALERNTRAITWRSNTLDDISAVLISDLQAACDIQLANSITGGMSTADKRCLEILDRLTAEADNRQPFWGWFVAWASNGGISLADLGIPQSIIDALSPENSLNRKYEKVTEDSKCAEWWQQVEALQCNI